MSTPHWLITVRIDGQARAAPLSRLSSPTHFFRSMPIAIAWVQMQGHSFSLAFQAG